MQNFQKSIKNATKLQKCDFADYILRICRHFLEIHRCPEGVEIGSKQLIFEFSDLNVGF